MNLVRIAASGLLLLLPAVMWAQGSPDATQAKLDVPESVKQGEVLVITIEGPAEYFKGATAALAGRKAPLFEQSPGHYRSLLATTVFQKPGSYPLMIQSSHGQKLMEKAITVANARYSTQNVGVSKQMGGLQPLPGEMEAIQALKVVSTPIAFWQEPFVTPTVDCQNSGFGNLRYHNGKPTGDYHKGVDLRSPAGRNITAINNGKIKIAKMFRLHGGTVGIDHGQGVSSVYIHMSKILVKEGQMVKKGDVIGKVGSTGFATGPHLHWGLYMNGLPVNPIQWIKGVPRC